jgi:probable phosphoglycerate mutase
VIEREEPAAASRQIAPGTRLVIVRHGEAVSNAEDIIAGHESCRGLTPHGRDQVRALAERITATGELQGVSALYSSVLRRAVETAEILAPSLGDLSFEKTCSLCERHPGRADGMTWTEYEAAYGSSVPGATEQRKLVLGEEPWNAFLDRAEDALYSVMERHPGGLVVVAGHGGLVAASVIRFLGLPANGAVIRQHADNASITEWQWTGWRWWFVRYNDAVHLDGVRWSERGSLRLPTPAWVTAEAG